MILCQNNQLNLELIINPPELTMRSDLVAAKFLGDVPYTSTVGIDFRQLKNQAVVGLNRPFSKPLFPAVALYFDSLPPQAEA